MATAAPVAVWPWFFSLPFTLIALRRVDLFCVCLADQIVAAPESDRGRVIAVNADNCPLCAHTMLIFTAAYGAEAGVAGLKWLPAGGKS